METAANSKTKSTVLKLMKSTGNTHVYHEEGHERHKQVFPTIYVQKHNFDPNYPAPDTIRVTMEWGN
jgi:hypothetical protein